MVSADRPAGAALASKNVALAVDGLENRERKRVLGTLEAYRGLAALVVVIIHGTSVLGTGLVPAHGYLAVDLFFVLSGIVMARSYGDRLANRTLSPTQFIRLRIIRLWPLIAFGALAAGLVELAVIASGRATPYAGVGSLGSSVLLTILLVPQPWIDGVNFFPLNTPYWSLFFEFWVNVLFALMWPLGGSRRLAILILLSALALVAGAIKADGFATSFHYQEMGVATARTLYCFFVGVVISRRPQKPHRTSNIIVIIGALACLVTFWSSWQNSFVWHDLIADLLVLPLVGWLTTRVEPGPGATKLARVLGRASYPVYALHMQIIILIVALSSMLGIRSLFPAQSLVLIVLPALILVGLAVDHYIDAPMRTWLSKR